MEEDNSPAPLRKSDKNLISKGVGSLLIILLLAAGAAGSYLFGTRQINTKVLGVQSSPTPVVAAFTVFLKIDFGNDLSVSVAQQVTDTETAFSLLEKTTKLKNMEFSYKSYPFGNMVESVNGIKSSADQAWLYYVNGQSPPTSADQYLIKPDDMVEWKYEKLTD